MHIFSNDELWCARALDDDTLEVSAYFGDEEYVEIPKTISGRKVSAIGSTEQVFLKQPVFSFRRKIETLAIPDSIVRIRPYIIAGCENLQQFLFFEGNDVFADIEGIIYTKDKTNLILFPCGRRGDYTLPVSPIAVSEGAFYQSRLYGLNCGSNVRQFPKNTFLHTMNLERVKFMNRNLNPAIFNDDNTWEELLDVINTDGLIQENYQEDDYPDACFDEPIPEVSSIDEAPHELNLAYCNEIQETTTDTRSNSLPPQAQDVLARGNGSEESKLQKKRILEFPWDTVDNPIVGDLRTLRNYLDKEMHGLDNAKLLTELWLSGVLHNPKTPVRPILLHGPPGTGKTTIARIIAEALGKPIETISIPACTAAWELTGQDKGWKGCDCGRIIASIINAKEMPVFLLDEVDKAGYGGNYSGPNNALLSILDGSRERFKDVFFDVEVDLSKAVFILTANDLYKVSEPLRDRCNVIEVKGYFGEERGILLRNFIIRATRKRLNLTEKQFKFTGRTISEILNHSEDPRGGVRMLEKATEMVAQTAIRKMIITKKQSTSLTDNEVKLALSLTDDMSTADCKRKIGFATNRAPTSSKSTHNAAP